MGAERIFQGKYIADTESDTEFKKGVALIFYVQNGKRIFWMVCRPISGEACQPPFQTRNRKLGPCQMHE